MFADNARISHRLAVSSDWFWESFGIYTLVISDFSGKFSEGRESYVC